jgi:hypothetical protein
VCYTFTDGGQVDSHCQTRSSSCHDEDVGEGMAARSTSVNLAGNQDIYAWDVDFEVCNHLTWTILFVTCKIRAVCVCTYELKYFIKRADYR